VSNELTESSESQEKCKKVVASIMQDVSRSAKKNMLIFYDQSMSRLNTTSTSRSSRLRLNNKRNRRAHDEDEDEEKKMKKKTRTLLLQISD
jgi:aspartate-semialdehyde dehydrogenase